MKAPAARKKEAEAKRKLAERAAERAAKTAAERAEDELKARFSEHRKNRAHEIIAQQGAREIAELGEIVATALPGIADYRRRWKERDIWLIVREFAFCL